MSRSPVSPRVLISASSRRRASSRRETKAPEQGGQIDVAERKAMWNDVRMRSYGQYCAVAKALDVIGDRWSLLIVRELMLRGPCRYTDIRDGLPGIATNLLADRLRELEEAGVIRREAAPPPVATTLFHLTPRGEELRSVVRALADWGAPLLGEAVGDDVFRSDWVRYPAALYLTDTEPE